MQVATLPSSAHPYCHAAPGAASPDRSPAGSTAIMRTAGWCMHRHMTQVHANVAEETCPLGRGMTTCTNPQARARSDTQADMLSHLVEDLAFSHGCCLLLSRSGTPGGAARTAQLNAGPSTKVCSNCNRRAAAALLYIKMLCSCCEVSGCPQCSSSLHGLFSSEDGEHSADGRSA